MEHIVSEGAFFNISKIHTKFQTTSHQYQNYTAHPYYMVHVPGRFRENTAVRLRVTVRKRNVTDRQTDGVFQYLPSRAIGAAGDNILSVFYGYPN